MFTGLTFTGSHLEISSLVFKIRSSENIHCNAVTIASKTGDSKRKPARKIGTKQEQRLNDWQKMF
jgi:hypothetical protein